MFRIKMILEDREIEKYLLSRNLLKQYLKAKKDVLEGRFKKADFKKRQPKNQDVYYFRINQKFRAIGYFEGDIFKVAYIDDHQK